MTGDPTIVTASVQIAYRASDGFSSKQAFSLATKEAREDCPPVKPMLDAFEELARLLVLFGYEPQAEAVFLSTRQRVSNWRKNRG